MDWTCSPTQKSTGDAQFERTITDVLSNDVLCKVFTHVTRDEMCSGLPLTCQAFRSALRSSGDLYQRMDVRLTGLARGTAPHTSDGALAALHLADLVLWLLPRALFVRELRLRLPGHAPPPPPGIEGKVGLRAYLRADDDAVGEVVAACCNVELVSLHYDGRLKALPEALVRLTALRELRIAACSTLERLPAFVGHLATLERLHISVDNQGSNTTVEHFLPVELLGCTRLAHVELDSCRSVHLPPVLGELPALSSVAVRGAKLLYEWRRDFSFQRGACGTERLAHLQLAACRLQTLPHWVCHMVNLVELDMSNNALSSLPAPLATSLRALRRLDLSRNAFTRLPQVLARIQSLERIGFAFNPQLEVFDGERGARGEFRQVVPAPPAAPVAPAALPGAGAGAAAPILALVQNPDAQACAPVPRRTVPLAQLVGNLPRLVELDLRGGPSKRWGRASWAQLALVRSAMAQGRCCLSVLQCDWID
ncbi:hypothetical protein WJX81_007890 [Elliptochloris bilobata]|uniref:Uncharacterized protein n=1 Tax=Elliptochloris bilobata TaxID=381761 RepID=A0AAW1RKS1_9CHLO